MQKILIIKTGGTFETLARDKGDFEQWTAAAMGVQPDQWTCVDVQHGESLPAPEDVAGCVITGSHDMVTDKTSWVVATEEWVREAFAVGLPMVGICFGHQLMADALGGRADYHPDGLEIGTVDICLTEARDDDPLFAGLPEILPVQVTHSQSARELPPDTVLLGGNGHEPHQAFRVGKHTWGVQFHPEFDATGIRFYVDQLKEKILSQGGDPEAIRAGVQETPVSAEVLKRFAAYCRGVNVNQGNAD